MDHLIKELREITPKTEGPVFQNLLDEYQKVILRSLVTTFGLDFIIKDQVGGDVDTVHNVRNKELGYKNPQNANNYKNREKYNSKVYHSDRRYNQMVTKVREKQEFISDAYVPNNTVFYGKSSDLKEHPEKRASLDHIVSANEIHEDPGRILAELNGVDLANSPENLHFTNTKLNSSKGHLTSEQFIEKKGNKLSDETKRTMRELDQKSRSDINTIINDAYYTSEKFYTDSIHASHKLGINMSIREAMGFILVEVFFSCKNRLEFVPSGASLSDYLHAIKKGVEDGLHNIKNNYEILFTILGEGYISGVIASLSTTLINAFITTDKVFIKNIRTSSVTLIRASNILLFNPGELFLGDRFKATLIILTTGVSSIFGETIGEYLKTSPIASIPEVGFITINFIKIMMSGLLSCTFLYMMDRSKFINDLVNHFNKYTPIGFDIDFYCNQFEMIAAQLNEFDIETFVNECDKYDQVINDIFACEDESSTEAALDSAMNELGIEIDELDDFLDGKNRNFNIN